MIIEDRTYLEESRQFKIESGNQERVDLVLSKLIPLKSSEKIQPGFFIVSTGQRVFSMEHSKLDRLAIIDGKTILREITFYGKPKPASKTQNFFNKTLYGLVKNPITASPVSNVNILLYPIKCSKPLVSTISNVSGHYLIDNIPNGIYRMTASKSGYYVFRAKFTIECDHQFVGFDIQLLPKSSLSCKYKNNQYTRMEQEFFNEKGSLFTEKIKRIEYPI